VSAYVFHVPSRSCTSNGRSLIDDHNGHATADRIKDAGDDATERGFSTAGLADQPDDLSGVDRERNAVERMHRARFDRAAERGRDALAERQARLEPLRDVLDLDQRAHVAGPFV